MKVRAIWMWPGKPLANRPGFPELRQELALQRMSLGTVLRKTLRPERAGDLYRESIAELESLLAEFPASKDFCSHLAACLTHQGNFLRERSRFKEAEKAYRHSLKRYQELAGEFPKDPVIRRLWGVAWSNLVGQRHFLS